MITFKKILFFILEKSHLSEIEIEREMIRMLLEFCFIISKYKYFNS